MLYSTMTFPRQYAIEEEDCAMLKEKFLERPSSSVPPRLVPKLVMVVLDLFVCVATKVEFCPVHFLGETFDASQSISYRLPFYCNYSNIRAYINGCYVVDLFLLRFAVILDDV